MLIDNVLSQGIQRSLVKTVTWRILATTDTFILGYWVMPLLLGIEPSFAFAGGIALLEVITKLVLYFGHERAWARVGRTRYIRQIEPYYQRRKRLRIM